MYKKKETHRPNRANTYVCVLYVEFHMDMHEIIYRLTTYVYEMIGLLWFTD